MTRRLAINYAKNYCNRTLIVKVIVENVVTCFFGTQCRIAYQCTAVRGLHNPLQITDFYAAKHNNLRAEKRMLS